MKIKKILFPTDFSHYNDAALKYASTLAAEAGAVLHIVHVDEMHDLNASMGEAGYMIAATMGPEGRPEVRKRLENILPKNNGVDYKHVYLTGEPISEILDYAKQEEVDLIVMASHGRTGLLRLLMGSIAEGVMREAPCPVLIVRQPLNEGARASDAEVNVAKY
jgi:nucleotide-binding universal stress UspA family protein